MSESSGRPTVRVPVYDEKPPSKVGAFVRGIGDKQNIEKTQKPVKPVKLPNQKPDWRASLPVWVRDAEPTERGFFWLRWYFFARTNFGSSREKNELKGQKVSVPKFEEYYKGCLDNGDFVRLTRQESEATVVVVAAGGGESKTTVMSLAAAQRRRSLDMPVIVYDGDASNPNVMMWFNLSEEGALTANQLSEYLKRTQTTPHFTDFLKWCAADRESGVQVIHAEEGKLLKAEDTKRIFSNTKPSVHTLFGDTQPGTFESSEATFAQVEVADIVVVAARASGTKGREGVSTTLNYAPYRLRDENGKVDERVLIVLSEVHPADFNIRTRYVLAERYNASPDQIVLIPMSKYLKGNDRIKNGDKSADKINKIRIMALDLRTRFAVSVLDRKISELAIRLNHKARLAQYVPPEVHRANFQLPEESEQRIYRHPVVQN